MITELILSLSGFFLGQGPDHVSPANYGDAIFQAFVRDGHRYLLGDNARKLLLVDVSQPQGDIPCHFGANAGPYPWKESGVFLTEQYRDVGITIVRTHDFLGPADWYTIFPDWEADPADPASYDFAESDERILSIVDAGAEVLFRIGVSIFAPWRARSIPDPQKFAEISIGIVRHYNEGWADGFELDIEYWEFWNEPDLRLFWTGTPQEFFEVYEATVRALKDLDPTLKVGGPGIAGPDNQNNPYFTGFLGYCQEHDVPLDFFSWHHYEGFGEHHASRYGEFAHTVRTELDRYGFEETMSICDEYNSDLLAGSGSILGTLEQAAFQIIANVHMLDNDVAMTCFYRGTQWDNEENVGLFEANGEYTPASYAFKALSSLRETPRRVRALGTEASYGVLAAIDLQENLLKVLIADQRSGYYRGYALLVAGLDGFSSIRVARYVLDEDHDLELVSAQEIPVHNARALIRAPMSSPSVHLLEITPDRTTKKIWPVSE